MSGRGTCCQSLDPGKHRPHQSTFCASAVRPLTSRYRGDSGTNGSTASSKTVGGGGGLEWRRSVAHRRDSREQSQKRDSKGPGPRESAAHPKARSTPQRGSACQCVEGRGAAAVSCLAASTWVAAQHKGAPAQASARTEHGCRWSRRHAHPNHGSHSNVAIRPDPAAALNSPSSTAHAPLTSRTYRAASELALLVPLSQQPRSPPR